jgi:cellulose synthase/poly-beta-1,6-N-acetylglucosamine synthase-like glycosyltransferase
MMKCKLFFPLIVLLLWALMVLSVSSKQQSTSVMSSPLTLQRPINRWRAPGYAMTQAQFTHYNSTLHLNIHSPRKKGQYIRLVNHALTFTPGQRYTLTFRGRSEMPRRIVAGVQWTADGVPHHQEGEEVYALNGDWQTFRQTFTAPRAWGNAYFEIGRLGGEVVLDSVTIDAGETSIVDSVSSLFKDNLVLIGLLFTMTLVPVIFSKRSGSDLRIIVPGLLVLCLIADYVWWRVTTTHWALVWLALPVLLADTLSNVPFMGLLTTFWPRSRSKSLEPVLDSDPYELPIFILIPTVNEGKEVLEPTVRGALAARDAYLAEHPQACVRIVLCNDGRVGKYAKWEEIEYLADELGVEYVTRTMPGGAKAGNIENAQKVLGIIGSGLLVVFDADQIAHPDFLLKTVPPFADSRVAWVQTPQRYLNLENPVARWANEQQAFFYDVLCPERARVNAAPICGTNVVIRAKALDSIGGFPLDSVTEDAAASLLLHPTWQGIYLSEYLADGLGPMDMEGFFKQQRRWAVGMLELFFFRMNPLKSKLSFLQWLQYALAGLHYLRGLRDAILFLGPVVFLLTGYSPIIGVDLLALEKHILPLFLASQLLVWFWLGGKMTWRTVLLGYGSFPVYTQALWNVLIGSHVAFEVTPKQKHVQSKLVLLPHYIAIALGIVALGRGATQPLTTPIVVTMLCVVYGLVGLFSVVVLHLQTATQKVTTKQTITETEKESAICLG